MGDVLSPPATEEVTGPCLLYTVYDDAYARIEPSRITASLGRLQPGIAYPVLRRNQDEAWFMVDFDGITAWAGVQSTRLEGDCSGLPVYEAGEEVPSATEEPRPPG